MAQSASLRAPPGWGPRPLPRRQCPERLGPHWVAHLRQGRAARPCGFELQGPRSDAGRAGLETPEAVQPSLTRSWPLPGRHL